ncbi:sporulation histidine kinase inhibitor Sda [Virgibacillus oceani]|uniref:Sporulation protein n=1 Tax=Virgibacillus oceani TaxID=1479511 RepID=A0A917HQH4_9BACI|nr:sporulation histidine kinase inhibitor Sda [Virgibacillus oceani]GGG87153.1 hypothetical protein GCM10011398_36240 [Virgibacillus oceani]
MEPLNEYLLLEAYKKAIDLDLDREFLTILECEIKRREINPLHYFKAGYPKSNDTKCSLLGNK